MTLLDDLKKIRRTRWSSLAWPGSCPALAQQFSSARDAAACRGELSKQLLLAHDALSQEASLSRYGPTAREVLAALLGLSEETVELTAEARYRVASLLAAVPVATLKTRDSNLLLDAFARHLDHAASLDLPTRPEPLVVTTLAPPALSPERRRHLETTIRRALDELAPTVGEAAWAYGAAPILATGTNPERLRRQMSYTAGIEYRRIGSLYCYQVSSSFRSLRTLPTLDPLDVGFCRTNAALEEEFRRPASISVELSDFDDDTWWELAADRSASVVHVDGVECPQVAVTRDTDVIRRSFEVPRRDRSSHRPVHIRNTYLIPASTRLYPIVIGDYFCAGPVEMSVTLIDPKARDLDVFVYLSNGEPWGPPGSGATPLVEVERFLTPVGTRQHTVRLRTLGSAWIWPHGGADFAWHRR